MLRTLTAALVGLLLAATTAAGSHHTHHARGHGVGHHPGCWTSSCDVRAGRSWAKHHPPAFTGWVIPEYIVICESKGTNEPANGPLAASGYYQIIPSTWAENGGSPPDDAAQHSKAEQDAVALRILHSAGLSAWACA